MSELNKIELPPLPEPEDMDYVRWAYSADAMRSYAEDAVAAALARQSPAPIPEQVAQAANIYKSAVELLAQPVHDAAAPSATCTGCDPAEGFCRECREKEQRDRVAAKSEQSAKGD